jgi:hypothetical protein
MGAIIAIAALLRVAVAMTVDCACA